MAPFIQIDFTPLRIKPIMAMNRGGTRFHTATRRGAFTGNDSPCSPRARPRAPEEYRVRTPRRALASATQKLPRNQSTHMDISSLFRSPGVCDFEPDHGASERIKICRPWYGCWGYTRTSFTSGPYVKGPGLLDHLTLHGNRGRLAGLRPGVPPGCPSSRSANNHAPSPCYRMRNPLKPSNIAAKE